jgi:hypothetical protein
MSTTPKDSTAAALTTRNTDPSGDLRASVQTEAEKAAVQQLVDEMKQRESFQDQAKEAPAIMKRNVLAHHCVPISL